MVLSKKPKELQTLSFKDPKMSMQLSKLDRFAELARYLKNKPRQTLLQLLDANGPMTVSDAYTALGWDQSYCSQLLGGMRKLGIVISERDGHFVVYSLNQEMFQKIKALVDDILD